MADLLQTGSTDSGAGSVQLAQASAVGQVSSLAGSATVIRADGSTGALQNGSPIFQDDTIETAAGAQIKVTFVDDSTVGLGANGRLTVDRFVYSPDQDSGQMSVGFAQGLFSFTSGAIAKTGDNNMEITTPVATIGIRGTSGVGGAGPEGVENYFVLLPDQDGTIGEFSVRTAVGAEILTVPLSTVTVNSANAAPSTPEVLTLQQLQDRFPGVAELLTTVIDQLNPDESFETEEEAAPEDDGTGDRGSVDEEGDAGGDDGETATASDDDLSEEELEQLAEEMNDLETAAGSEEGEGEGESETAGTDEVEDPSPFMTELASVNEVQTFGTEEGFGTGTGTSFGSGTKSTGDSSVFLVEEEVAENTGDTIGGLRVIDAPISGSVLRDGIDVVVRTPVSLFGGVAGTSAFEQVVVDLSAPSAAKGAATLAIGQDSEGNVRVAGPDVGLAMDDIEELNVTLGSGSDLVTIGSLSNTDIAPSTVIIHGGDGDDVITASDDVGRNLDIFAGDGDDQVTGSNGNDEILGQAGADSLLGGAGNDSIFGGIGNDMIDGGDGDDSLFGSGSELLESAPHVWGIGSSLPVFSELESFNVDNAVPASEANLSFNESQVISARFITEGAGYKNSIGYYTYGEDGQINGVQFIFPNASLEGSGGTLDNGDTVVLDVPSGETLGLFLISNGASLNDFSTFDDPSGYFEFRDASGTIATTASDEATLYYVTTDADGNEEAQALTGKVFHATLDNLNPNDSVGAYAGINPANSALRLGFEDNRPGDFDYNDVVIEIIAAPAEDPVDNDDILLGGAGNDRLYGESGDDILDGGSGIDVLFGGANDDVLIGGEGFDILYGGTGSDVFQYNSVLDTPSGDGGRDVIMDFETARDSIFLNDLLAGSYEVSIVSMGGGKYEVSVDADGDTNADLTVEVNVIDGGTLDESHITSSSAA